MNKLIKISTILLISTVCLYVSVTHKSTQSKVRTEIITVKAEPLTSTLFYSGIIQPIRKGVVISYADGTVEKMLFRYGDKVKSGQLLFIISSEKFHTDYKTTLMQYIKTKSDFLTNKNQLNESLFLQKNQLISADDFKAKKNNFYNSQLEMIQSRESLANMLRPLDLNGYNLYSLKIEDIDKITKFLSTQDGTQRLKILASTNGMILEAPKSDNNDGELKKMIESSQVKSGDILAVIGDLSGLVVHINVNEFNITQLKLGQEVDVTGAAFPVYVLKGKITDINRQGESVQNGVPVFSVDISVNNLTPEQQAVILMGMSVKVAINIVEGEKISIPLKAVTQKNDIFYVKVKDDKSNKTHDVVVKLGKTTLDSVIVESNLTPGEKIVVTS